MEIIPANTPLSSVPYKTDESPIWTKPTTDTGRRYLGFLLGLDDTFHKLWLISYKVERGFFISNIRKCLVPFWDVKEKISKIELYSDSVRMVCKDGGFIVILAILSQSLLYVSNRLKIGRFKVTANIILRVCPMQTPELLVGLRPQHLWYSKYLLCFNLINDFHLFPSCSKSCFLTYPFRPFWTARCQTEKM